jgi:glutamate synthase domain-containing protein 2/nitrite reductase/ring-hydroxylating ferredoxin subunit
MQPVVVANWSELEDRTPAGALVGNVDLVIVRYEEDVSVLYGRCLHRGALMADSTVDDGNLLCGLHGWDYCFRTGISSYDNTERLHRFEAWLDDGQVFVDADEIAAWELEHPQPYDRGAYQGTWQDPHGTSLEPHVGAIRHLGGDGLDALGHHGAVASMGVPRDELPSWDSIQITTAQLARRPLMDDDPVATDVTIGPKAKRPLELDIPILVSDMSFGALSLEAKTALAAGAEAAGTAICSGEGGMLPEEKANSSRYLYELASGGFGWELEKVADVQAFHFKFGQGAKTGTGGHLPGIKVKGRIAEVRGLEPGTAAVSPATFPELRTPGDFAELAAQVREVSGGVPIGAKLSAQRIESDIDAALEIGVDYVIVDGRGGGTGAAPTLFRDNISVPTIPALARARRHLDRSGSDVTLVITGGLRTAPDFVKALALGADAIAVANSAMQAIGCLGMRACNTDNCPVGIATQKEHLRARLPVGEAAARLARFLGASVDLMKVLARACGHDHLSGFGIDDLTTFDREMHHLAGVPYGGLIP